MTEFSPISGASTPSIPLDSTPSSKELASSESGQPESARAKADREFRAVFLREILRPLTQKLFQSSSSGSATGPSGSGVYQFFMEEALATTLAESWPLPQAIPEEPAGSESIEKKEPLRRAPTLVRETGAATSKPPDTAPANLLETPESSITTPDGIPSLPEALISRAARIFELPRNLVRAVVLAESGGRTDAVSPKGAQGLMQLMPGTARDMGIVDRLDPWQNLYAGTRYLSRQLERFGDLPRALAAYNAGPGAVERHQGIPPFHETRRYIQKVLDWKSRLDTVRPNDS